MEERLQKIIAQAGLASRRGAERLIAAGRVKVNGVVADQLGAKADPEKDRVEVDGRVLEGAEPTVYYMINKPAGFITTAKDPRGRPAIARLTAGLPARVFPVGRLDMDAEGLLILTNDGDLAKRLMHPRHHVSKTYRVKVSGVPNPAALRKLTAGEIIVEGKPVLPAEVEVIKTSADRAWLRVTLREGRYHQVKRMCQAVGHPVLKLKRTEYGPLKLGRLETGAVRPLTRGEIEALKRSAGM